MTQRYIHAIALAGGAALSGACGGTPDVDADDPVCLESPCVPFGPLDGVGRGGAARIVGTEFRASGVRLLADEDGGSWLAWRSHEDPTDFSGTLRIDRFSPEGFWVGTSTLTAFGPHDLARLPGGELVGWQNHCGDTLDDVCFAIETGAHAPRRVDWPVEDRTIQAHALDENGELDGVVSLDARLRFLLGLAPAAASTYALTNEGEYRLHRLNEDFMSEGSRRVLPRVTTRDLAPDAPLEDLLRAFDLIQQTATPPVATTGGVVVAAAVAKGTLAAINAEYGRDLPLPADPTCADILVVRMPHEGAPEHWVIPTPVCERLPKMTVVNDRVFVASVVAVPRSPSANDTEEYDAAVSIVDLSTGSTRAVTFGSEEDEWVETIAPCGLEQACLGGVFGSRSVDTGSVVSFGDGFITAIDATGELGPTWSLTSDRHATVHHLAPAPSGDVLFFATTDGPITHTGDRDPSLNFDEGRLGRVRPDLPPSVLGGNSP